MIHDNSVAQLIIRDSRAYPSDTPQQVFGAFNDLDVEVLRMLDHAGVLVRTPALLLPVTC